MKTKLLSLFVALICASSLSASDTQVDGIWYDFDSSTKTASVTYKGSSYSYYSNEYSGSVVIPETVTYNSTTYSVTTIGYGAFCGCKGLTSVTIPNSVTTIGGYAFEHCTGLTSVTIGNSVTTIGFTAFFDCTSLTSVTIPNSVTTIETKAFSGCSGLAKVEINSDTYLSQDFSSNYEQCPSRVFGSQVTEYVIGDSVKTIGDYAFYYCISLTSVTIGNSVTTIGKLAFNDCQGLTSVIIPNSVTTIDQSAFDGCTNITSVIWNAKNYKSFYYEHAPFYNIREQITSFNFGNEVEIIPSYLCYGMDKLTSVTIPNSVTTIGSSAFRNCYKLSSVTIPNSVTMIGDEAFYHCTGLTSVTIPNSVTTIGDKAFDGCTGLNGVYITDLTAWCKIKFKNYSANPLCYANNLYLNNQLITDLVIPNSVTMIDNYAFYGCNNTSVTIPNSVTTIGYEAFYKCARLTSINVDAANTRYCSIDGVLFNYAKDILVQYPAATTRTEYTIPNSVTMIGLEAFCNCGGLTSITIPNSVKTIGEDAFRWCTGLTSVTIPNSVTTIGDGAFYECFRLTTIAIPNSVTTIGERAFYDCPNLTSVTIGNSVTTIGDWAFEGCSGLTSVTIGNSVTTIGSYAFSGCSLSSITIPNSVKTIGDYAFYNCERISTITFGSGLWEIGDYAFSGDYRIADITCYAEVTPTIYAYTFEGITKKNVYLYVPENVIRRYQIDPYWNEFDIRTKSADVKPITGDQATVLPSANDAILTWPISNGAYTYTITITKGGETICLLTFNAQGQLQNIAFAAPGHDGAHQAPAATLTAQGYQFTVTGLNPGTAYNYSVTATDTGGETLAEYKGNFSTTGGTGLNTLPYKGKDGIGSKYFHNGNLIIERNGVKYTATGQKVR